jgi:hypothetical protein
LDRERFGPTQQSQKDINVRSIFRQMADADAGSADLGRIIPQQISIARIARSVCGICFVQEQTG